MAVTLDNCKVEHGHVMTGDEWDKSPMKLTQDLPTHLPTDVLRK